MNTEHSLTAQPIRSLQTMLRTIAQVHPQQPPVIPDGVYSPQTEQAVLAFQKMKGLPVSGAVDQSTWDAVVSEYEHCRIQTAPAQHLTLTLKPGAIIQLGDDQVHIPLIQTMLFVLSQIYDTIPEPEITGIWDIPSQDALAAFQTYADLEPSGELDKQTWRHLALHYTLASDASRNGSFGG